MNRIAIILFVFMVFTYQSTGQTNSVPRINQKQDYHLKSKINHNNYQLFVSLPENYSKTDTTRYPVLYLLDGNYTFPIAHSTRQLLDLSGSLEDVIIVGIGYTWEKSYEHWYVERWKDFTPSSDIISDTSRAFLALLNLKTSSLASGGAQAFMNALQREIIPFIEKKYKVNADKGIAGHSLGGLFAAYSLFQEPKLFNRYGINSPSLWWHSDEIFIVEKSFAKKNKNLNAQVFISVGSREGASMVPKMKAFVDSLNAHNYTAFSLTSHVFEDEGHFSVVPASISRTLLELYPAKKK
jgi:predicted alpha/beta superfamily hydrolase